MALDPQIAKRLWESRYRKELEVFARKNAHLHEYKDAEDLFHDMVIGVWMKAVDLFDPSRVTYLKLDPSDPNYLKNYERAFNAIFTTTLIGFLDNLKSHRDTGKQQWMRKVRRLDTPLSTDDDDEGATLLDTLSAATDDGDRENTEAFQDMLGAIPEELREPLKFMVDNLERGNTSAVWDELRQRFIDPQTKKGWTKTRFINALFNNEEFVEWATNI
jgi:hypothetical protein